MASLDLGDYLGSALALIALTTLIWQIKKLRSAPLPTGWQLITIVISGFIVSLASGFLATAGCLIVALNSSLSWPHGSQNLPPWAEFLFTASIPLGVVIALIGFASTARFIFRQSTKPINLSPEDTTY
ncbi:MAG: hypothetical protein QNL33_04925 [Akkermansiaceae bacterium]|jgi:hypothetical protein